LGRPFFTQATDYSLAGCAPVHLKQRTKAERLSPQSNRSLLKPVSSRAHPGSHAINQIVNPATCAGGQAVIYQHQKEGTSEMQNRRIVMNAVDHVGLSSAIGAMDRLSERGRTEMIALRGELERAEIVAPHEVPPGVITMNSRAELLDLDTNEHMEFTLVFPDEADIEEGKISVLAPLGTAMLGYGVGDEFEWTVPYGSRRLKVIKVHFQPEASAKNAGVRSEDLIVAPSTRGYSTWQV
jgi:regulator of nucleoside diphosphate kinase